MTIRFIAASQLPTPWATFTMHGFEDEATGKDHIALTLGDVTGDAPVLGRVHSECLTGDALFSALLKRVVACCFICAKRGVVLGC